MFVFLLSKTARDNTGTLFEHFPQVFAGVLPGGVLLGRQNIHVFLNTEIVVKIDVLAAEDDGADFPLPGVDPGQVLGDTGAPGELHLLDRPDARYANNQEYLSGWFLCGGRAERENLCIIMTYQHNLQHHISYKYETRKTPVLYLFR